MVKKFPLAVKCKTYQIEWVNKDLKPLGFKYNGKNTFIGRLNPAVFPKFMKVCDRYDLMYELVKYNEKSNDYKDKFFADFKPQYKNAYFCAYCGRIINKSAVEISHLYPPSEIKRNVNLKFRLMKRNIFNADDIKNLVPACKKCFRKKGNKTGMWVIKGKLGRHGGLWPVRHFMNTFLSLVIFYGFTSGFLYRVFVWFINLIMKGY